MDRKYCKNSLLLGLILLAFSWQVDLGQQNSNNPMTVEYCELVKHPEEYDGKKVFVRASYRYGFEWQEMFCLSCRDQGKTWLEIDEDNITRSTKRTLKKLPKDDGTVNAIFIGRFQSSDGPFGDGDYRFRFILAEIRQAEVVTKSGADPEQLSTATRKKVCDARAVHE